MNKEQIKTSAGKKLLLLDQQLVLSYKLALNDFNLEADQQNRIIQT